MPSLIPLPSVIEWTGGELLLTERTTIGSSVGAGPEATEAVQAARLVLSGATNLPLTVTDNQY